MPEAIELGNPEDLFNKPVDGGGDTAQLPEATEQPTETLAAPPSQPSIPSSVLERARSAGLELGDIDSSDRLSEFLLDQYIQARPYADYGRQSLANPAQYVAGNKGEVAPEPGDEEAGEEDFDLDGHFNGLWSTPEVDSQARFAIQNGIVRLGENGLYEAAPGFETMALPILQGLNQSHMAQKELMGKLFEGNPYRNIYNSLLPAIRHELSRDFQRLSQESVKSYENQTFEQQFIEQNKSWLYGSNGSWSQKGQEFAQAVQALRQNGMTDPKQLAEWAMLKIGGAPQAAPPTQNAGSQQAAQAAAGAPAPSNGRPRDEHGRYLPAGTPAPVEQKTKQESFIDEARRKAAASSNRSGSYTDAGGDTVVSNPDELENMWMHDWRKHKGAGV